MDKYEKIGLYNEQINCYMSTVIHKKYIKICHKYYNAKIEYFKKLLNNLYYSKDNYASLFEFKYNFNIWISKK